MAHTPPKSAALYVRLSEDRTGAGDNVANQIDGGKALAKSLGMTVVDIYDDNDRKASEPSDPDPSHRTHRPEFERLLRDAETGKIDAVICRHIDRFYRHPADLLRISNTLGPKGITIHQEWAGFPIDLSTPSGVLNAGIHAQVALYEIQHKRERQRATNAALLKAGKPLKGGPRPFGFNKDMTPHLAEAAEIGLATQKVLSGTSLAEIIRDWNERAIPASRGGQWGYSSMRTLLLRWSNAGIRQQTITDPKTGRKTVMEHGPAAWEGFINEADFRALRAKLEDPARISHQGQTGRKHLLSHILICSKCRSPMRAGWTKTRAGKQYLMYQCSGSNCRLGVDYQTAERVVIDAVVTRLAMPSASMLELTEREREKAGQAHKRLFAIETDERLIEESKISPTSKIRQLEVLNTEREQLQDMLRGIAQRMALASLLTDQIPIFTAKDGKMKASVDRAVQARQEAFERFSALDLNTKREIIRALFSITVEPHHRGVRPTKSTAAQRISMTPLNPMMQEPEDGEVSEVG